MSGVLDPLRAASEVHGSAIGWSAAVRGADSSADDVLDADLVLPTASVGKVFLLLAAFDGIERGDVDPAELVSVAADDLVADSGLLQFLDGTTLTLADACRFVGAVSDNLATNVVLRRVGLDRVDATTAQLGVTASRLNRPVRDQVRPDDPPYLSTGTGRELATLMHQIACGEAVSEPVSRNVAELLRLNTDLSMVASAFALDPLAHVDEDLGVRLFNKTGTQTGTRADIGWVEPVGQVSGGRGVAYAVIARFDDSARVRRAVLDAMRSVGDNIRGLLGG